MTVIPFDATDVERLEAWCLPLPLLDHSQAAIGRVWTAADHEHLTRCVRKMDRLAEDTIRSVQRERDEARMERNG